MKSKNLVLLILILSAFSFIFVSCEREWDNLWDEGNNLNPEDWAPYDLAIKANSQNSIIINWKDNSNGEEGFKIDRKVNQGAWEIEYAFVNSNQTTFVENGLNLLNNTYTYRLYAYFNEFHSQKTESSVITFQCKDSRDNKEYETIVIGTQCWMKENLAYLPSVSPSANDSQTWPFYYVYGYQGTNVTEAKATSNYHTYGVLYNWTAALTACPAGWHLPSDAEWTALTTFLGGESVAGGKMKEADTAHWNSPNTGATNESGFTGLPGGSRNVVYNIGSFSDFGNYSNWWSSTDAWNRILDYYNDDINRQNMYKSYGFNVRCLRDE